MTQATVGIDPATLAAVEADDGLPEFVSCTPLLGTARVLPTKTIPTTGILRWRWRWIRRPVEVDGARIRVGDRTGNYPLEGGLIRTAGALTIEAALNDLLK